MIEGQTEKAYNKLKITKGANLIQLISPTPPTIKQTKKGLII